MRIKFFNIFILLLVGILGMVIALQFANHYTNIISTVFYRSFGDKNVFTKLVEVEKMETPFDIEKYLMENYEYKLDKITHGVPEYWQTPMETYHLKSGDCEDFAFLTQELLNQIGIKAKVYSFWAKDKGGHSITIFSYQGLLWIFDNQYLRPTRYSTPYEIITKKYNSLPVYGAIL